ncbi:hypothetical protein CEK60_00145 [Halomonas sp. N3-2A]|nr:hypothetical protein CEK60_00145 [Halomonas sp. N3-2A]
MLNALDKIGFTNLQKICINSNEAPQSCQTRITHHGVFWPYTLVIKQTSGANSHQFASLLLLRQTIKAPTIGLTNYEDLH